MADRDCLEFAKQFPCHGVLIRVKPQRGFDKRIWAANDIRSEIGCKFTDLQVAGTDRAIVVDPDYKAIDRHAVWRVGDVLWPPTRIAFAVA